jgi:hypothetical protein
MYLPAGQIGINPRKPLFKLGLVPPSPQSGVITKLQPMPTSGIPMEEAAATKGYFLGGLFPDREEVMERLRKQQEEARKPSRIATFMEENPDFARSLASVYRNYSA